MKVRIAVAVDSDGRWLAAGDCESSDEESAYDASSAIALGEFRHVVFVEANVPLPPKSKTVKGKVKK